MDILDNVSQDYLRRLPQCLVTFQFVEEALRMYVDSVDLVIQDKMKDFFHYDGLGESLSKMSLGSLIREFDRRTDRNDIVSSLKRLARERNYFAHQGYLLSLKQLAGYTDISDLTSRLDDAHEKAIECLESLKHEIKRVRGE